MNIPPLDQPTPAPADVLRAIAKTHRRDLFAAHALAGILANPDISQHAAAAGKTPESFREAVADAARDTADALLKALDE